MVAVCAAMSFGTSATESIAPEILFEQGEYARAIDLFRDRLDALRASSRRQSIEALRALERLVTMRSVMMLHDERTVELARDLLAVCRERLGSDHPRTGSAMLLLADVLSRRDLAGSEREVAELRDRAVEIHESTLPGASFRLALTRCQAATFTGGLSLGERLRRRAEALAAMRQASDGDPLMQSMCMNSQAVHLSRHHGTRAGAEAWRELLAFRQRELGDEHPVTAYTHHNLANMAGRAGRLEEALERRRLVVRVLGDKLGEDSGMARFARMHLALTLRQRGELEEAFRILSRLYERKPEEPNEYVLLNLSDVALDLGNTERARRMLDRGIEMREARLGADNWFSAALRVQRSHMILDVSTDPVERAAACDDFQRYLEITRDERGPKHEDMARGHRGLARCALERAEADLDGAAQHAARVVQIRRETLGDEDVRIADALADLGRIELRRGRPKQALELTGEALSIAEDGSLALRVRALALEQLDKPHQAFEVAIRGAETERRRLTLALGLPERRARSFALAHRGGLDVALSLLSRRTGGPAGVADAWSEVSERRVAVLDAAARRHAALHRAGSPEVRELADELSAARRRAAHLALSMDDGEADELDAALAEIDALERDLEQLLPAETSSRWSRVPGEEALSAARSALPDDGAIAAYVGFDRTDPTGAESEPWYGVFVARRTGEPVFRALAPRRRIDELVRRWRARADGSGRDLRREILDPVLEAAGPVERLRVVTDGALALVSFYALPGRDRGFVIDESLRVHVAASERGLGRLPDAAAALTAADVPTEPDTTPAVPRPGSGLLIVAAPDFDERSTSSEPALAPDSGESALLRSGAPPCLAERDFAPLRGALAEAAELAALWPEPDRVVRLVGPRATPEALARHAPGKRIVHVATHGFFEENGCTDAPPLLRAGLALAGANLDRPGDSDGLLSAEEVASLDLRGVEWVVLSACDTALGHPTAGEGVLGLQRAVRIAGARTLIASLWKTRDATTRWFMSRLYEERLQHGRSTEDALYEATRALLGTLRREGGSPDPRLWAAFVAIGDPH